MMYLLSISIDLGLHSVARLQATEVVKLITDLGAVGFKINIKNKKRPFMLFCGVFATILAHTGVIVQRCTFKEKRCN